MMAIGKCKFVAWIRPVIPAGELPAAVIISSCREPQNMLIDLLGLTPPPGTVALFLNGRIYFVESRFRSAFGKDCLGLITGLWLRSCLYDLASLLGSWFSRDSIILKFINKEIFTFALKPVNSPTFVDIFKHVFQVRTHED